MSRKAKYIDWCQEKTALPIFYQPAWLDNVCGKGSWDVCISQTNQGEIRGVLPYHISRYRGISVLKMPKLTPYLGPWFDIPPSPNRYKWERRYVKVCNDLMSQLPDAVFVFLLCHPSIRNVLPFQWKKFTASTRYTFRFDIDKYKTLTLDKLDASVQHNINVARESLTISETTNALLLYDLVTKNFAHKKSKVPFSAKYLSDVHQTLSKLTAGRIFMAQDSDAISHAGILIAFDQDTAYSLVIGSDPSLRQSGAVQWLLWHAISWARERKLNFDFEGSMIKSIYHSFQDFNADLVPYMELSKGKNSIFTILGQTMRKRI